MSFLLLEKHTEREKGPDSKSAPCAKALMAVSWIACLYVSLHFRKVENMERDGM